MANTKDLTEKVLKNFFELVDDLVNELDVEDLPNCFYNLDEVGLVLDQKARKCFHHRRTKNTQFLVPMKRKSIFRVLFCRNASV